MKFNLKDAPYDDRFLLNLWTYLYFSNEKSFLDKEKGVFWKRKGLYKVTWMDRYLFKSEKITFSEIEYVKESLKKFSIDDIKIIVLYIEVMNITDPFKSTISLINQTIKKIFVVAISFLISYKILPPEQILKTITDKNFVEVILELLLYFAIFIYYFRPLYLDSTHFRKKEEIKKILPKILQDVIDESK